MADFTDDVDLTFTIPGNAPYEYPQVILNMTSAVVVVPTFFQRIFDSSLAQYVYYTLETVTDAPAVGDTTPNHTNNLVVATHEVIKEN